MRCRLGLTAGAALAMLPSPSQAASSVRYALVVGNNQAGSPELPLRDLRHAEREAARMSELLVELGNFDADRVILVTGGGRRDVLGAAQRLVELHQKDREQLHGLPTLFAFYFTGHGLSDRLLTSDEPLTGADLGAIFRDMDATMSVGFFDACFAESLEGGLLAVKGAVATPGFNPFTTMPREVLRSEGKIWFVSSRPNEQSFEDTRYGGLLTHYFSEAFRRAAPDDVAITLDQMWEYARRHTEAHAARYGVRQTPVKIVHDLKARGPLYFSFPRPRDATVRLAPELQGTFLLRYGDGALVEKVVKQAGAALDVALYAGDVVLSRVAPERGPSMARQSFRLRPGGVANVKAETAQPGVGAPLGYSEVVIQGKGRLEGLVVTEQRPGPSLNVELGYGVVPGDAAVLVGRHRADAGAGVSYGRLSAGLGLSWSWRRKEYEQWSLHLHELGARVHVGCGILVNDWRLDIDAGVEPRLQLVGYSDGPNQRRTALWIGAGLRLLVPLVGRLALQARTAAGATRSRGVAAANEQLYWTFAPVLDVGVVLPLGQ